MLATRRGCAAVLARHPDQISRHVQPVACDVSTKLDLYDVDEADATTSKLRRRVA